MINVLNLSFDCEATMKKGYVRVLYVLECKDYISQLSRNKTATISLTVSLMLYKVMFCLREWFLIQIILKQQMNTNKKNKADIIYYLKEK